MKIYLREQHDRNRPSYLRRISSTQWELRTEEPHDFDWTVREMNEFESNLVESVFQHFAEPMKSLIGD